MDATSSACLEASKTGEVNVRDLEAGALPEDGEHRCGFHDSGFSLYHIVEASSLTEDILAKNVGQSQCLDEYLEGACIFICDATS